MKHFYRLMLLSFLGLVAFVNFSHAQIFITEIADPNNNAGARYIELYNAGSSSVDLTGYEIRIYFNANSSPGATNTLSGTIPAEGFFIVSDNDANFTAAYGFSSDQDGSVNSNGDDNFELYDASLTLIDVFGVPGEDGTGTDHEFEDGRAERKEFVSSGNTTWDASEWNIDNDSGGGDGTQDAPGDFDPGAWIGPDETAPIFEAGFPAISNINSTGFEIDVQLDEAGIFYYVVVTDGSGTPLAADVQGATATGQVTSGSQAVSDAATTATTLVTGLTTSTTYDVYVVAEDLSGNLQADGAVVELADVTPVADVIAPTLTGAATETGAAQTITLTFDEVVTTTDATGFSVAINAGAATVSGISGSGSDELVLSISEEIFVGDVVTVSYDDTQGDVADGASNAFASVTDQAVTNNATVNLVADIAGARALSGGDEVRISGEVLVTHLTNNSRDQIFIQDASGGILIDDNDPVITTSYSVGDGITNLEGTLGSFGGVTQLVPLSDPGAASSTGNTITPLTVTIDVFNADVDSYESELLLLEEVTFTNADGSTAYGDPSSDYSTISDGVNTTTFDADGFLGADYTSDVIPYGRLDLVVLGRENSGTPIVTSRSAVDIQDNYAPLFTVAPVASNQTIEGADITFQADEEGTFYYYVLADGAGAPTVLDVITNGTSVAFTDVASDVTVTISGLADNTPFDVYVLAVDDETVPNEQDTPALVEFTTLEISFDATTDITALASPITGTAISSLNDTDVEAVDVFGFTLTDEGSDGVSTLVDAIVIEAGGNNTADWVRTIDGATLSDGVTDYPMTISETELSLDLSGSEYELANSAGQEFTLSIWLETEVTDEDVLEFEIPTAHSFTATTAGSIFVNPIASAVTSAQHTIDVTATGFETVSPEFAAIASDFSVSVTAIDANGNIDLAARNVSISKNVGTGSLTGTGLTGQAMTDGVFSWTDLQLDLVDDYVLAIDDDGSALTEAINVSAIAVTDAAAQILISEVAVTPTDGEFIEIYNTTEDVVALDDYYLTDATFAGGSTYYYNITTGTNAGGGGFGDWHARFPAGSVIGPGEVQTISLTGSEAFFTEYGIQPDYELFEDGSGADAIPDMEEALAGSINDQGGLTNGDEMVVLYYWDGTTDLVTDIDYFVWGNTSDGVDKTGVSIDGPDGDSDATAYQTDLALGSQIVVSSSTHANGNTWQRVDFTEGAETATGGNGVDGNNEMTEDLNNTFIEDTANPGEILEPGTPLITLNTESFDGGFGFIELGQSSVPTSYTISASDLTGDVTLTIPDGFEVAAEVEFLAILPNGFTLSPTDGVIDPIELFVRFTPLIADEIYAGEIVHSATGAESKSVSVTGTEGTFDTAPNLSGIVISEVLADPNFTGTEGYDTDGSGGAETQDEFVEIYNSSESPVDISGWQLFEEDGAFFTFPAATTLGAGNYAAVIAEVQTGGTLPTPTSGNFAFESDALSISNGGENIALYDPNSGNYIQMKFGDGEGDFDYSGSTGGSLVSIIEDWGVDEDGSSLVREPADGTTIVVHETVAGALAASFAEPTVDADAPIITADLESFIGDFNNISIGEENVSSLEYQYGLSANNLTDDLTITAPDDFEISIDGSAFLPSVTLTNGGTVDVTVEVRFSPSALGSRDGTIVHSSPGAQDLEIDVTGAGIDENTLYFEGFASCETLGGFAAQSVVGDQVWECTEDGETGDAVSMSGFSFDTFSGVANEDWLVSPVIELNAIEGADLSFDTDVAFDGSGTLTVQVSTDYAGDVTTATWTELDAVFDVYSEETENDGVFVNSGNVFISGGADVYIGFKYETGDDSDVVEYRLDNFLVYETQPFFTVDESNFTSDFQIQDVGTSSPATSFTIEGFGLTDDVTVTPPAQFEVSTSSDFASAATNASPLTITATDGAVDQEVFVRFSPTAAGSFSGNVVVETAGFDNVTLSVSGVGDEDEEPALGLNDNLSLVVYPNPIQDAFEINNQTGKAIFVQVYALDGSIMSVTKRDNFYDISALRSGVYVLVIKDENNTELSRQQIIKQ